MNRRYRDARVHTTWSDENKFGLWQKVELVVPKAREQLKRIKPGTHRRMEKILLSKPIRVRWIERRDKVIHHDLNAFIEERVHYLPSTLEAEFHKAMTSYDTEESAFVIMLKDSCRYVISDCLALLDVLQEKALLYRYTPMGGRTHGQLAEMQSFGKRCLTWYKDLRAALGGLEGTMVSLRYSKLSGAIGTNSGIDPELEKVALGLLGLLPWSGATQIMPRILYAPIASALADLVCVIDKIAYDIRLASRSGRSLMHEPFGDLQKGSSAMPHKKNPIHDENTEGMGIMARNFANGLRETIRTWEERAIAQSSVERNFWPDLFHVTLRAIKNTTRVAKGLVVYPDTMLQEIVESRGTYASNHAKEFLVERALKHGLKREEVYRLVQHACFRRIQTLDVRSGGPAQCCARPYPG
jgi:adenylosuccinate lyase